EYFQQWLPEAGMLLIERRRVTAELAIRVLRVLSAHGERERIRRAIAQYHQALRNWEPGLEILAPAHLWMAGEALTPAIRRRLLEAHATNSAGLADLWKIELKQLDPEIRRRIIMRGDEEAYSKARDASDGLEHGYRDFAEIRAGSIDVRLRVAENLRKSVLEE